MIWMKTGRARFSFLDKVGATLLLVLLADFLFFRQEPGASLGVFALAWTAALVLVVPAVRTGASARITLAAACLFSLILIDDPNPLAFALFWIALSVAALLARMKSFGTASRMAVRLFLHALSMPVTAAADITRLRRLPRPLGRPTVRTLLPVVALPIAGGTLFLLLFRAANPVIESALRTIHLPELGFVSLVRGLFWFAVVGAVWTSLRPRAIVTRAGPAAIESRAVLPGVSVASVTASLLLFNLIFAIQNALDLVFLWSGGPLPEGVSLAEYAHRGAYPLIVTALLAGLFVLATLRPGSATAANPLIRRLVTFWIGQNIFLVASSMLRTIDYIEVYSLTRLRIAALAWMVLVALGLALICWRMLKGRSSLWLINANAAAAAVLLTLGAVVDIGAVAAAWNVRHAREVGGKGAALDLCYLRHLGRSALLPMIGLEARPHPPAFRERLSAVRQDVLANLERQQADWHSWTWRDARRLSEARQRIGGRVTRVAPAPYGRRCDGAPRPMVVVASPTPAPPPPGAAVDRRTGAMIECPMPRTILVADDDPHIRQLLAFALNKAGLDAIEAEDGESALAAVRQHRPDLIVLDINMPRMDGIEVCRRIRAESELPVLFLSSRDEELDRVLGIELGADDYVTKPFSPREVVARIQAILRRVSAHPPAVAEAVPTIRRGMLTLDVDGWQAKWGEAEVPLTVTEFGILRTLAAMPSKVFSRDAIIDRLHGPGFALTERTVDSHVRNLRAKFAQAGASDIVETRAGIGYRLGACSGG